jgi:DNA-binding NarL/FixJ family response regulator
VDRIFLIMLTATEAARQHDEPRPVASASPTRSSVSHDTIVRGMVHNDLMAAVRSRLHRAGAGQQATAAAGGFTLNFENHAPLIAAFDLTEQEADVLSWMAQGKGNTDIGILLHMTECTVIQHLAACFQKIGVEDRSAATLLTVEALSGLRSPSSKG